LPAEEQAVVDEFATVIRKYRNQGLAALARLARVAFDLSVRAKSPRRDGLALAMARGLEARQQLAEAEGGSLSSNEVASLLGISKTAVLRRLEAGRLVAWREGRLQAARFPRWQFDRHGRVLSGLERVLTILNRNQRLDAWGKILFFLQIEGTLGNKRPLDLLREGRLEDVRLAAEAYID
jgi:excisionase family DNA binding protein